MTFEIALGLGGWVALVLGALIVGGLAQVLGEARLGYEWIVVAIAAGLGALVASEFVTAWRAIEPVFEGLAVLPAVIGGLVVGIIVELITRFASGGTYGHRPMSA